VDLGLDGRVAIVTGGAAGIGSAIAVALAEEGCDVAVVDSGNVEQAKVTVRAVEDAGRRGLFLQRDVRDHDRAAEVVQHVLAQLGRLDILVCNAGITQDGVIWKMTEQQWDAVLDVNLKGYFNYNKAAAALFKDQKRGKIVNISSINGLRGKFAQTNYSASKGGIIAMSKALAQELGKFNVNVNVVAPGMVMTDMARQLAPEFLTKATDESALGRLATPADCANVVVFLCSERSRHITGEVITVDGGQYM